jgi:hypothetical protein
LPVGGLFALNPFGFIVTLGSTGMESAIMGMGKRQVDASHDGLAAVAPLRDFCTSCARNL